MTLENLDVLYKRAIILYKPKLTSVVKLEIVDNIMVYSKNNKGSYDTR